MKYGLTLPIGGICSDPRLLAEFAHLAEQSGWDGVFLEDYIVYQGQAGMPTCDPWIALAAMALATRRVRLGTTVTPLSRRRPWKLARETVTLDHLSGGRLVLGVGLGDPSDQTFTQFGEETDPRKRAALLDEGLAVLVQIWSGEPVCFHGQVYHVDGPALLPKPVQAPRIPIWVGGAWPNKGPVARASRWDGACLYKLPNGENGDGVLDAAEIRALKAAMLDGRAEGAPFDIVTGGVPRGKDWEAVRRRIRGLSDAGATWWTEWVPPGSKGEMLAAVSRAPLWAD
jgi:alkanesulfonate monooxygenase SsuD/methylene tetrahydromethanopterin reductase-like flavin-dependent oxidoreductase (luciferase family)